MRIQIILLSLLFCVTFPLIVDARSGCCSHHGGVCGCRCCDGTSLSATCAPYYPQCSTSKSKPLIEQPPVVKQPVEQNTDSNSIDSNKLLAELPKEDNRGSFWWWIIGLGFVIYLFYVFKKKK